MFKRDRLEVMLSKITDKQFNAIWKHTYGYIPGAAHQNLDVSWWYMVTSGKSAVRFSGKELRARVVLPEGIGHGSRGETICGGAQRVFRGAA